MDNKLSFVLCTLALTVVVLPYFFSQKPSLWIKKSLAHKSLDASIWSVHLLRIMGFFWLGSAAAVFIMIYGIDFYDLLIVSHSGIWLIVLGLIIIIQGINYFNASSETNLALYPQIRKKNWSPGLLLSSACTWILYLSAYEFLIRGVLLFSTISVFNQTIAIAVNVCIYAILHLPKGWKETLASIPFGIVMCLLTIKSQAIWPAIFTHAALALSNEWFSIYYQPQMSVKWR